MFDLVFSGCIFDLSTSYAQIVFFLLVQNSKMTGSLKMYFLKINVLVLQCLLLILDLVCVTFTEKLSNLFIALYLFY